MISRQLISVIVPAYNIALYAAACVHSILQQSYPDIEVILVDDGSTDGTPAVLQELMEEDPRVKVIHQENGGVTRARLAGVRAAQGEWIGFVDGDDIIEPDMYERLLLNANRYGADISHCGYQMVFPGRTEYYYNTGRLVHQDRQTGLKDLIEGSFVDPGLWNKLFHKSLFHDLLQNEVMDLTIRNTEDLLMNYYLFREAKQSVYEDFCPYHYKIRGGSAATSKLNENKLRDPLKVLTIIKGQTKGSPELQKAVNTRIAGKLVSLTAKSTYELSEAEEEMVSKYRKIARRRLRKMLPTLLLGDYPKRTKLLSGWAVMSPRSFQFVHKIYAHWCGTDRKYEVS